MKLQLEAVTQAFMEDDSFIYLENVADLNTGDCYLFAYISYLIYNGELLSFNNSFLGHAFIKINDRYFDAEVTKGVKNWEHLPFFKRSSIYILNTKPSIQNEEEFIEHWNFGQVDLNSVLTRSKQLIARM